jgi:DHA2 family methylenomycin A resistance protein-like MFS transporter
VTLCVAFFMVILDTTIVNVALPAMGAGLHSTVTGLQWVVDGYTLVFAALLLAGGSACDRLGGRRVLAVGLAAFTAGSALCAFAPGLTLLVAARLLQGAGAAAVLPASLALIAAGFPGRRARARAIGVWAAVGGAATATGPVAGGLMVQLAGWRAIFLVNVPIGAAGLAMARRYLPETVRRPRPFDLPGQALAAGCLALVTFALVEAGSLGWASSLVLGCGALAVVLGAAFIVAERRAAFPMLPRQLLASPAFSAANAVGLILNFGIYGQVFVLSLYFQQARGDTALATGLALLPFAGMTVAGPAAVGRLTAKVGPRPPMVAGQLLAAAGSGVLALAGSSTSYGILAGGLACLGAGMALTMPSMTAAVVQATPAELAGVASGVLSTARQVGGAVGVAILGSLVAGPARLVTGMHAGLWIVAAAFAVGAAVALRHAGLPRPGMRLAPSAAGQGTR